MIEQNEGKVPVTIETDIVTVRKTVRDVVAALGFGVTDMTRIVTAASELARNIFLYAGSGAMEWRTLKRDNKVGVELTFEDNGPGIADIKQAMEMGYSTSGGLGMGLPGTKRLVDEMEIQSEVGKGTIVTVRKWFRGGSTGKDNEQNNRNIAFQ